jgi:hypothetical protein
MAVARSRPARAGKTEKVSISLDRSDLNLLRRRARRLYGGNLSAVVAEGVRRIREEEGRKALVAWLGNAADATPSELEAIRDEWRAHAARGGRLRGK